MKSDPIERGVFGMPRPQGWSLERVVSLMARTVVLATLILGRQHSDRWRILTGFVGANLALNAAVGWCPMSVVLHQLGVSTAAERALSSDR
jgi:Protein of unknown function (DUF2892)